MNWKHSKSSHAPQPSTTKAIKVLTFRKTLREPPIPGGRDRNKLLNSGSVALAFVLLVTSVILSNCGGKSKSYPKESKEAIEALQREQLLLEIEQLVQHWETKTPLDIAVGLRRVDMVRVILEGGANPNERCGKQLPLNQALLPEVPIEIVDMLLASGAKTDLSDGSGYFPIHCASASRDLVRVQKILHAGGRVDERTVLDEDYENPESGSEAAFLKNHELQRGQNLAVGAQPIHLAASRGWIEGVKYLIASGAKGDAVDNNGGTILDYARGDRQEGLNGDRLAVVRLFEPDHQEEAPVKINFFPNQRD